MKKITGILLISLVTILKLQGQCSISGSPDICVGSTTQLTGEGTPSETNPWVSSAPGVATVTNTGLVTGVSEGTCIITYTTEDNCSSSITLNVFAITYPLFNQVGPYCEGALIPALPTTSNNGISGTWSPDINNSATTIYTFIPTSGQCIANATMTIVINPVPSAPVIGTITQPGCSVPTGTVQFSGLPASGNWTITSSPGSLTITGSGTSATFTNLPPGTYSFTVTNSAGCVSQASPEVTINSPPANPGPPVVGNITQPTCTVGFGSVILNELPESGTWTITRSPGNINYTGSGTSTTITDLAPNTYTFTVTNANGCTSVPSQSVTINPQPTTPSPPGIGTVTQPTCTVATGSIQLTGLPASGNWTVTRTPGNITTTGSGTTITITGIAPGNYSFTVTGSSGCTSLPSANVTINSQPPTPSAPTIGTITHPTCNTSTGSVQLSGLPSFGTWTITSSPGSLTHSGSGVSTTFTGLASGSYTFTVTNAEGCTSLASQSVTINPQPATPTPPGIGIVTQPTCTVATGSIQLTGLPASGNWTVTRTPGNISTTGSGTTTTITGIAPGNYSFTVTGSSGCTSLPSANVTINSQPPTPSAPTIGTITHPTCNTSTGSVQLSGLPSSGTWTITSSPGSLTHMGSGASTTFTGLASGTYTFTVTNAEGCTSLASQSVTINPQPATPTPPGIGTVTQPTCTVATGSIQLTGLPASGNWTVTRTPGNISTTGSGTTTTITGIAPGTYTFTVTNAGGCISVASQSVTINPQPATPSTPGIGTDTQPTCTVATGSIQLTGLPASGNWTVTRTPGNINHTGSGASTTITGLTPGSYTFTVTNAEGCTSLASQSATINSQPATPNPPGIGTVTQPTCTVATGSIQLTGLPASGNWTITRMPGNITSTGNGTTTTISSLTPGSYTFTVTGSSGCTSLPTSGIVINSQPATPAAPVAANIIQPTCSVSTGGVTINGLPSSGNWTLTRMPGGITINGNGTTTTVSGLVPGTYTFTVTNSVGCTSPASQSITINSQPPVPSAPVPGTVTHPTIDNPTGSVILNGLPATGTWTIQREPGNARTTGTGVSTMISGLAPGTYTFTVTNSAGCTSPPSTAIGLFLLKLTGPDGKQIRSNDTLKIEKPEAGSMLLKVESNGDWNVTDNAVWIKTVKENQSSLKITWFENISVKDKTGRINISYPSNPEVVIHFKQNGRVSRLRESKFANVRIYPNPASDLIYIDYGEENPGKLVLTLTNIHGNILMVEKPNDITAGEITEINISKLPSGTYFLRISDGVQFMSYRVIKY